MSDSTDAAQRDRCLALQEEMFIAFRKLADVADVKADVRRIEGDVKELRDLHLSLEKTVNTSLIELNAKMGILIQGNLDIQPYLDSAKKGKKWLNNICYVVTALFFLAMIVKMPLSEIFRTVLEIATK